MPSPIYLGEILFLNIQETQQLEEALDKKIHTYKAQVELCHCH
jgi:hypothetical protein